MLRAEAPAQRHLYMTEWRSIDVMAARSGAALVVGDQVLTLPADTERLSSRALRHELAAKFRGGLRAEIVTVLGTQRASLDRLPLIALEVGLTFVQTQAAVASPPVVWLITAGILDHMGLWGIGRSARTEVSLPLVCIHTPMSMAFTLSSALSEPDAALCQRMIYTPRLKTAPSPFDGLVRLHFHARGAIANLFLEPQPALQSLGDAERILHVQAVGLNFRDVLNVLGEYPGDPGPPGGDAAGNVVSEESSMLHPVFGFGSAPLASVAISPKHLLADKSTALSFEETSTLPVTWITAHVTAERAWLCSGHAILVQAAAGGVGLKAIEYVQWLHAAPIGTAGRPHKHAQLRGTGIAASISSRDGVAHAFGALLSLVLHSACSCCYVLKPHTSSFCMCAHVCT